MEAALTISALFAGFAIYGGICFLGGMFYGAKRQKQWDGQAMSIKKSDQIEMLKTCRTFTDTGEWKGMFSYPGCGWDLVKSGLVTEDKKITVAGRAALWFLDEGDDPIPESKASIEFSIPLVNKAAPAQSE